jgi:cephalosporin-C deacetylase-like acetyl esterase
MKKYFYPLLLSLFFPVVLWAQNPQTTIPSLPNKKPAVPAKAPAEARPKNTPIILPAQEAEGEDPEGEILIKIKASPKSGLLRSSQTLGYKVDLKSTYKVKQDGKLTVMVTTDMGEKVTEKFYNVKLGKEGSRTVNVDLPRQQPGFYQVKFMVNLSFYDDTLKRIYGVDPDKVVVPMNKPGDFDTFWENTKTILAKIEPQYKVTRQADLSTKEKDVYLVEMHSWGNAVIRGWLTIPVKRSKKMPVKYRLPGYVITMKPTMDDDEFIVFNLNVRGNGNSKDALKYNGEYNLYHINSRDEYIYRAVYMDCVRGMDFLSAYAEYFGMDEDRVAVVGGSQGGGLAIALAGIDTRAKLVTAELPLYCSLRSALKISAALYPEKKSPIWMLGEYVRKTPSFNEKRLFALWDYFDPINFAPNVKCPVLLAVSLLDELCPPRASFAMYNQLGSKKKETWVSPNLTHEVDESYYTFQYYWIKESFVLP